jgi:hypothetical protein
MSAADDVRLILATSEDTFTAGAVTSPSFITSYDDEIETDTFGGSKQIIRRTYALVCTDDYPAVTEDNLVSATHDGVTTNYKVLDTRRIQDGHMMQVNLQIVRP